MQYFIRCKKMFLKFFPAFLFYHATATVRSWFWWKFTKFSRSLKHFHQFNISVVLGFLVLCQTNYSGCVFFPSKNDYFTRSILKLPSFFACSLFPFTFCSNVRICILLRSVKWKFDQQMKWIAIEVHRAWQKPMCLTSDSSLKKKLQCGCNKTDSHSSGDEDVCNIFALISSIFIEFVFHLFPTYYHFLLLTL